MLNWSIDTDDNGYCWLTLDRQNASANTLGEQVLLEFDQILDSFVKQPPKGLVIKSGKSSGFIAGADISEFMLVTTATEATELVRTVQKIFDKLEALPCPTVAMINGFCLGGGLELSLACKFRVAEDNPKTKIGLPEVLIGVQPGWGGSIRLPKLIGSMQALPLILAGKIVDARTAAKLGIVDAAVPDRHMRAAVEYYLSGAAQPRAISKTEKLLKFKPARYALAKIFQGQLSKKVNRKHYPAPYAVLDTWIKNSMQAEAESIGQLMVTSTARNLVRVFFLRDRLKGMAKTVKFTPKHVHVVGAGVMGGDIAAWCALNGFTVTVQDQYLPAIAATLKRALQLYSKKFKQPYLIQAARDRLIPDTAGLGVANADVIIEAIIEDVAAKQALFKTLEANAKPDAVLASNTSTIPLKVIGANLVNPQRVVGIHFFNPVALMQLVEVVYEPDTSPDVIARAMAFVSKIDKLPLPVRSMPGFLVNRVLIEYLLESALIYVEGVPGAAIDKAATDFGMMMGPIELMDTVGLDICIAAGKNLNKPLPESLVNIVKAGNLGKKTGSGFYKYVGGKVIKPPVTGVIPGDLAERMILRLVNESMACLREGIVTDADLVDAGLVFGAGFAPFLGGPMQYAKDQGYAQIKQRLEALVSKYGARFTPDSGWGGITNN